MDSSLQKSDIPSDGVPDEMVNSTTGIQHKNEAESKGSIDQSIGDANNSGVATKSSINNSQKSDVNYSKGDIPQAGTLGTTKSIQSNPNDSVNENDPSKVYGANAAHEQKSDEAENAVHVVGMDDSFMIISSDMTAEENIPDEEIQSQNKSSSSKISARNGKRGPVTSFDKEHPQKKSKEAISSMDVSLSGKTPSNEIESSSNGVVGKQSSENSEAKVESSSDKNAGKSVSMAAEVKNPSSSASESGANPTDVVASLKSNDSTDYSNIIDSSLSELIKLDEIPPVEDLKSLTLSDIAELESALQIGDKFHHGPDDGWKNDWSGNLQLYEKEVIVNRGYLTSQSSIKPIKIPYYGWVAKNAENSDGLRGLQLLFSYVFHMKGTPDMAKKIMAYSLQRPAQSPEQRLDFILDAVRRISYDPVVLHQDGWTTKKAQTPDGLLGGAFLIGRRIIWQRYEALVIAFVRDDEFGALWKAVWIEDLDTFDLEAGELQDAMRKWDNKQAKIKKNKAQDVRSSGSGSTRFSANAKFTVDGIEHGIVLAAPTNKGSRGILWPARVMNVVETNLLASGNVRRNASKSIVQVVFLAPFWNGQTSSLSKLSDIKDPYSLGPLFEIDTVEVSENCIQKYPFESLSMEQLLGNFRFLGLPKAAFSRYMDSHRLAVALKNYAMKCISSNHSHGDDHAFASASLTESHALAVVTPIFPQVVLSLPFGFILSKLPHPSEHASIALDSDENSVIEPVIDIEAIVRSLSPPECFGKKLPSAGPHDCTTPEANQKRTLILSPNPIFSSSSKVSSVASKTEADEAVWSLNNFASELLIGLFQSQPAGNDFSIDGLGYMEKLLSSLVLKLRHLSIEVKNQERKKQVKELKHFLCQCLLVKGHGEDSLEFSTSLAGVSKRTIAIEWRKACERIFKRAIGKLSFYGIGNGITSVLTDSRCNGHITADGSYERPVRIPAAIRGAKMAGAGSNPHINLITKVEDKYLEMAEEVVIPKAHKTSYVKRLKIKISAIPADAKGVPLTDDSEGEGGEDTVGSRGSYTAATVGVAAALKAVDMVVGGQCVNVFCAVRPPGHHAGRELRPMKAISNGFCLLNAAACAAMYAATPQSEGGLGLRRVCVIDFDVHHGNGTQDILCSTYDPRFLYVSLHAGGAHINGFDDENSEDESFRRRLGGRSKDGIFPGRCGDSSPHEGVLNIPLGQRVTATAVGTAFVSQVSPKVENFSPDLIILSAGFDAHKNDPLGMGGLSAEDFGSLTEVACQMAFKMCSGRVLSVLEGGYGVPCCRPRDDIFLPNSSEDHLLDLGEDLPDNMGDPVPLLLRQKLDKCHAEGFLQCVKEHVSAFVKCNGGIRK